MTMPSRASVFVHRWAGFASAIWLMQFSGSYCFSIYSTALKHVLHINQVQLNNLSVAKDLGDAMGVVAGVMSNYIPAWALLTIGATVGLLGYGTQWLVVSTNIRPLPYWMMFLAALLAGNSVSWMNTAVFMMSVKNFPRNRGPVVGLYKAYMGLTAAVFAELSAVLFSSSPSMLLLLLTILPAGMCILSALCLRPLPPPETEEEHKEEERSMFLFNVVAVCLAVYLAVIDVYLPKTGVARRVLVGLFLLILAAPIFVPFYVFYKIKGNVARSQSEDHFNRDDNKKIGFDQGALKQPLLKDPMNEFTEKSNPWSCVGQLPELGEERSTVQLLRSWDFFIFYISCFCGIGAGVTFINNLGQISQAMGVGSVTLITSFFSLGNFFGRLCSGNASEYFLRTAALPRSVWMGLAKLPMVAMFLWLATGSQASLYGGSIILGVCHGLHVTVMIPIVSEFYGLKYFGTNYTFSTTSLLAGSSVFSGLLAGKLYDMVAWKQRQEKSATTTILTCTGPSCYGLTFIILVVALVVGAGGDGLLSFVSRRLYRKLQKENTATSEGDT